MRAHIRAGSGVLTMARKDKSTGTKKALSRFEHADDCGAIESRIEREERINDLPPAEKELAQETARFADLCQYFEQHKMDGPGEIVDQLNQASRLPIPERTEAIKKLNQRLMGYLNDTGKDSFIRQ